MLCFWLNSPWAGAYFAIDLLLAPEEYLLMMSAALLLLSDSVF
jgi:hypothetical protein